MFDLPHHQRIAQVLTLLNGEYLAGQNCLFGGGTAITLLHGEYRESVDVDFVISDIGSYRELRLRVNEAGILDLTSPQQELVTQLKPVRADQYGIRTVLSVQGIPVNPGSAHRARSPRPRARDLRDFGPQSARSRRNEVARQQ